MATVSSAGPIVTGFGEPWEQYLHLGIKREYPANRILLYPGEKTEILYYVQKGQVLISRFASEDDIVRINIIQDKAMLGITSMFTPVPSMTTWMTLRPCTCWLFTRDCVRNEVPRELLINLLEQQSFMNSTMTRRFFQGANKKRNEARLAQLLLHLVEACDIHRLDDGSLWVMPGITQEITGELIGLHPVTFNKILANFRAEGIIGKYTKNRLEVLDADSLCKYAEGSMPPMKLRPGMADQNGNGAPKYKKQAAMFP